MIGQNVHGFPKKKMAVCETNSVICTAKDG